MGKCPAKRKTNDLLRETFHIPPMLQKRNKAEASMLLLVFEKVECHFSGLGLKLGVNFHVLHPLIGSCFKTLRGTHLSEIYGVVGK